MDDSALVRAILTRGLSEDPGLEVVGAARDPYEARDLLVKLRPDVITLDVEMPRMDGITFLRLFMAVLPTPTIVLSSLTARGSTLAQQALLEGAVAVVTKPASNVEDGLSTLMAELIRCIKLAAVRQVTKRPSTVVDNPAPPTTAALDRTTDLVIGIGASTGGVAALGRILPMFPAWSPGIVIVQHMPAGFTADFARRLDGQCSIRVAEAADGDRVLRGHVLVAPGGDQHLEVHRFGGEYRVRLIAGPLTSGHRPSIDVFFHSLAHHVGRNASACLLTGMGDDGAKGLLAMRMAGGRTSAQDRETSAVWGMPAAAQQLGAAERLVPLVDIPATLLRDLHG